ncbi:MAG: HAMP domain-containing histidine kinase [Gammaproteobacteria bacterium]|nr:HAMP domain-containing histidine kinase [Gammaproteobacteria bacterium]
MSGSQRFRDKIHSLSLGARIVWVFIFMAVFSIFIFGTAFKLVTNTDEKPLLTKLISDYGSYLITELGEPAQLSQAKIIAERTGMKIYIERENIIIGTTDIPINPKWNKGYDHHKFTHNDLIFHLRFIHGQAILSVKKPTETIIFVVSFRKAPYEVGLIFLVFLLSVMLVIYIAYRLVRKLIEPIQLIGKGVSTYAKGDLSYRIEKKRNDDLGELTEHINQMAGQLNNMLEAKRQLLLAISHELRTPLTRMKITLELPWNEKNKIRLNSSLSQMEKLLSELLESEMLVNDHHVLDFQKISVNHLISDLIEQEYSDNSQIKLRLTEQDSQVSADAVRIRLLIRNLLSNAIKYGSENPVTIATQIENNQVILSVSDEGEGIEESNLPHLYDAFYREDQARQRQTGGSGLGLYLVKLIVDAHEGSINIQSKKGKGTVVTVSLSQFLEK